MPTSPKQHQSSEVHWRTRLRCRWLFEAVKFRAAQRGTTDVPDIADIADIADVDVQMSMDVNARSTINSNNWKKHPRIVLKKRYLKERLDIQHSPESDSSLILEPELLPSESKDTPESESKVGAAISLARRLFEPSGKRKRSLNKRRREETGKRHASSGSSGAGGSGGKDMITELPASKKQRLTLQVKSSDRALKPRQIRIQ